MADGIKNVFISHVHEDDEGLGKLRNLLANNGMRIRDYSVRSDNPNNAKSEEYIKEKILAPRINASGALLVYVSPKTRESNYVNWEVEYAAKNDKRIIGVWAWGENSCELPKALDDNFDAIVGWRGNSIVDAINGELDGYEGADGTQREDRPLRRHPC